MNEPTDQLPRTPRGHLHVEAFCLMQYACRDCGHREVFWNSRDGVTPFCTACPSCGQPSLSHVNFHADRYAPDHKPHKGQRIWLSMTKERAQALATKAVLARKKPSKETDQIIESVANSYYHDGHGPDLQVFGYEEQS